MTGKGYDIIEQLKRKRRLDEEGYRTLLEGRDEDMSGRLRRAAREASTERFGHAVYIRGLIEISNICRNDCLYCGIRKSNGNVRRYRLSADEILDRCKSGYSLGFRTFVLQGGELPDEADAWIERLCSSVSHEFPDCALTLSLGERSEESYRRFFRAGATRYLLRHETRNPEHYARLHPHEMSLRHRLQCIGTLKAIGYQTGTGIMVGSPYQTVGDIIEDIRYMEELQPEMIGIGPFIPHRDTPFSGWYSQTDTVPPSGDERKIMKSDTGLQDTTDRLRDRTDLEDRRLELTLNLISVFRLMFPDALIPATTALATLTPDGTVQGILAGANVVMPNLSPATVRKDYSLYDGKASEGPEASEGLGSLKDRLGKNGYRIVTDRGDFSPAPFRLEAL